MTATELRIADDALRRVARRYWYPAAYATEVTAEAPIGVRVLDEDLVVWREPDGAVAALEDRCIHRGTRLSIGDVAESGCVRCPYHGWEYDARGVCTFLPQLPDGPIPARARVRAAAARESAGIVWVCLEGDDPARDVPALPHDGDPAYRVYCGTGFDIEASAGRQVENTFDFAHFSVLHASIFGNDAALEVEPYEVRRSDDGLTLGTDYTYHAVHPLGVPGPDGRRPPMLVHYHYRVELPYTSIFTLEIPGEAVTTILTASRPISATRARVLWVVETIDGEVPDEVAEAVNWAILMQDKPVVESQQPARLPLDPTAELQLPFDRFAVAYRRALVDLGFPT